MAVEIKSKRSLITNCCIAVSGVRKCKERVKIQPVIPSTCLVRGACLCSASPHGLSVLCMAESIFVGVHGALAVYECDWVAVFG
ncbi:hypothetical protein E2C01_090993 [Portunus trituberculatus]|uniref:Uncharacterized protein n=1 Tax=Portunus trituberculatus TaxID=210409 RepID=A0A5B7JRL4_PORTR|nr:hypothetical protein [Portunus trituberculatus]